MPKLFLSAQQDSLHFPACVSEGLHRAARPEGLHPDSSASSEGRAARLAAGITRGTL